MQRWDTFTRRLGSARQGAYSVRVCATILSATTELIIRKIVNSAVESDSVGT